MRRSLLWMAALLVAGPATLAAQQNATVRQAQQAYDDIDYERAAQLARQALDQGLSGADAVTAWQIAAYSYASLGMDDEADEAFKALIYLDPSAEPDPLQFAPRIISAYTNALAAVLVVRYPDVESTQFVSGQGSADITFELSRPARARVTVVGQSLDLQLDEFLVQRRGAVEWNALDVAGNPVPPGDYEVIIEAEELGNSHIATVPIAVRQAPVDTVPHIDRITGFSYLPEDEIPARDWRPLGVAGLYAGLSTGATFALSEAGLGDNWRMPVIAVSTTALLTGFVMSLKRPDAVPVPGNIQYNALLREQIARRNAEIAQENQNRRRQVLVTIEPREGGMQ
ncbi:MAG TPA: hypothetical protein VGA22_04740 [Gemmatimonadales bacterium]|jgi:hypothetical protein